MGGVFNIPIIRNASVRRMNMSGCPSVSRIKKALLSLTPKYETGPSVWAIQLHSASRDQNQPPNAPFIYSGPSHKLHSFARPHCFFFLFFLIPPPLLPLIALPRNPLSLFPWGDEGMFLCWQRWGGEKNGCEMNEFHKHFGNFFILH